MATRCIPTRVRPTRIPGLRPRRAAFALAWVVALTAPRAADAQTHFVAHLTPEQVVSSVTSTAQGIAAFTLTEDGLQFFVTVEGLSGPIETAAFGIAERGLDGGAVRVFTDDFFGGQASSSHTAWGLWRPSDSPPLDDAFLEQLYAGDVYVTVTTDLHPSGEIRGQVDVQGGAHCRAHLTGAQAEPPSGSSGWGTFSGTLTERGLEYKATLTGLDGALTAVTLRRGGIGTNGPVLRDLTATFAGNSTRGFWRTGSLPGLLDPTTFRQLLQGDVYIEVRTAAHPAGELRGQVRAASGFGVAGAVDAAQVLPATASGARGVLTGTLSPLGLALHLAVEDLEAPVTTIELRAGAPGSNGTVLRTLTAEADLGSDDATLSTVWRPTDAQPLDAAALAAIYRGDAYLLVSTLVHPGGEVRGQLTSAGGRTDLQSRLTGAQVEPASGAVATGAASWRLQGGVLDFEVTVRNLSGPVVSATLHTGGAGAEGASLVDLTASFDGASAQGSWNAASSPPLTLVEINQLLLGDAYLEIATEAYPGGEVRGQVQLAAGCGFEIALSGWQEVPPVATSARGLGAGTLTPDGLAFEIVVDDLDLYTVAHMHFGPTGTSGTILHFFGETFENGRFRKVWSPSDSSRPLNILRKRELLLGQVYANVHTGLSPGGEVRGQVLLRDGFAFSGTLSGGAEVPPVATPGLGTSFTLLGDAGAVHSLSAEDLTGTLTGAHFHEGAAGVNGPVVFEFTGAFDGNTARGVWDRDGAFPITGDLFAAFLEDRIYVNLHSTAAPGGEIRSQQIGTTPAGVPEGPAGPGLSVRLAVEVSPNPFRESTRLVYTLPEAAQVRLDLFDVAGRRVDARTLAHQAPGTHEVTIAAAPSERPGAGGGIYLYVLTAESAQGTRTARGKLLALR